MKLSKRMFVVEVTLLTLVLLLGVAAQGNARQNHVIQKQDAKHHHYKLVVIGTFGGPTSNYVDILGNNSVLTSRGSNTGAADTSTPDPYSPNYWWSNGLIAHTFLWRNHSLIDLGALPGTNNSAPTWISPNGLVAGVSENGQIDPVIQDFPETQAVLWSHGGITNLGNLPQGGYESEANSVNNSGQVVGAATDLVPDANSMILSNFLLWNLAYPYQSRAFVWDQKNGMQDLGTLPGGTDAEAVMNNERGQVVGHSYTNSAPGACAGYGYALTTGSFIWDEKRGMKDIGGLGGTCTLAYAMNNHGQVVGLSFLTGDQAQHPFLWDRSTGLADLGTLGGNFGSANAVNGNGEAAGWGNFSGDTAFHAALWTSVGQVTDLGAVGKDLCSYANGINDKTQVVGVSERHCGNPDVARPFLWEHGSIVNLNNLIPPNSPLYLVYAYDINHSGEIVGNGLDVNGNEHAFLLIPCDENHPGIEGCDYSQVHVSAELQTPEPTAARATTNGSKRSARRALPWFLGRDLPGAHISATSIPNKDDTVSAFCTRCCGQCRPVIELSPSNLDFPAQRVGTTSEAKIVSVRSIGRLPVVISSISIKPPFIESNTCPHILNPLQGCQIRVQFKPTTKGPVQSTLSVSDNAFGSPQKVVLSGLGN